MRWGIHTIEDFHPATHGPLPEFYDTLIARAVLAEELGYESFWLTEHHFHWFGGAHANPLVALSAIAARTRKLRLGTAVTLLPYRHPLLVAEEIACLDNLSHGRVDVGIGRGFFKKMQYFNYESLHGGRKALFGTPQHCAEVLELWRREVGITYTTIMPSWGGLPEATVHASMRRFAREVIPRVEAM